ncbi:MAG: GHKL domain-containing protein [Erysipelotrichaceae bacterium]
MTYSKKSLFLFGFLLAVYYIFDYTSTVYTNAFYMGIKMMNEFFPTVMVLFYIWFMVTYDGEVQMENGVPFTKEVDHGFGCKSIQSIAKARKGLCEFFLQDEIFTLKVVLPFE